MKRKLFLPFIGLAIVIIAGIAMSFKTSPKEQTSFTGKCLYNITSTVFTCPTNAIQECNTGADCPTSRLIYKCSAPSAPVDCITTTADDECEVDADCVDA